MRKDFMQYSELLKREKGLKQLENNGFKFIYKRNWFKFSVGVGCLVVAIIPNCLGFVCYPLGFYLIGFNRVDLFKHKQNLLRKFKVFIQLKGGLKNGNNKKNN